jgi:hypothetical protein
VYVRIFRRTQAEIAVAQSWRGFQRTYGFLCTDSYSVLRTQEPSSDRQKAHGFWLPDRVYGFVYGSVRKPVRKPVRKAGSCAAPLRELDNVLQFTRN